MKRRSFLKHLGSAGILLPGVLGSRSLTAFAQTMGHSPFFRPAGGQENVIVVLRLSGGNDGINTVVPYHNESYYKARTQGGADVSVRPEQVLPIAGSSTLGFNANFGKMAQLYQEGKVAVVQNVGYPNQDLSHFRSTDVWLTAYDPDRFEAAGWYARYLESRYPEYPELLPSDPYAIELGTTLGLSLLGKRHDMGVALFDLSYIPDLPGPAEEEILSRDKEESYLRQLQRQVNIFAGSILSAQNSVPANMVRPTDTTLGRDLGTVARLIAGGLRTQMYVVNIDGFDTHHNHVSRHNWMLGHLGECLYRFQRDLEAFGIDHRVTTMTISEFGRRIPTVGNGTEHGAAAPMFVIGSRVQGGIIGHDPDIDDLMADGSLKMEHDFRQVYASVLGQWLGASDREIGAALPRRFAQLPLFRSGGASSVADASAAAAFTLGQNAPNPAAGSTTIPFDGIPAGTSAMLALYTLDGRLVHAVPVMPGERSVTIDVRALPSGTYLYELVAGPLRRARMMVVAQ